MSEDITGYQTSVQTLSPGSPSVTISGTINAYGTVGQYSAEINGALWVFTAEAALFAPAAGRFTITNAGLIGTQGSVSGNLADAGVLLGAAGTVRNTGTILGGSGVVVFETLGNSTIENANFIEGLFGVGVIVFGNTATNATVVNSGTILGAPDHDGGAVDVFGNGFVSNAAGGVLIADASYAIGGQAGLVTVVNSGAITGFFGGINLQGGGFASNAGYIHALGLGDTLSQSSYVGINADLGGTAVNSGTILGQNGINVHYSNGTITSVIQGYAANTGLIEAFSTYGLQGIDINGSGNFGVGIELQMPGTVVNAGSITATSAGIYTENGFAVVRNAQSGVITSQIGIDLSANSTNGGPQANIGYAENSGTVIAYSTVNVTGNFRSGFDQTGVGVYAAAAGTVVNHGTIAGNHVGVVFWNGIGTVINSGVITEASGAEVAGATPGYGVYLHKGGTVTNTGTIIGQDQAIFAGYTFNIVNSGYLDAPMEPFTVSGANPAYTAISTAIFGLGTGEVTNAIGGTVDASTGVGIFVYGLAEDEAVGGEVPVAATLENQGLVRAQYGVQFYGLGSVNNSGTILGTVFAAKFFVPPPQALPTLVNSGLLAAGFGEVAELGATVAGVGVTLSGGIVFNLAGGTITADTAIFSSDFTRYSDPFSLNNAGLIAGYRFGVYASNASELVVNSGSITAASTKAGPGSYQTSGGVYGAGAYLAAGGTVINNGAVAGTNVGIAIEAIAGSVANSGIVIGNYAIYLQGGGQATNTGTVIATNQGIGSGGSETDSAGPTGITNSGVIDLSGIPYAVDDGGVTFTAVATGILDFGGTVDNSAGGVILAPHGAGIAQYGELRNPLNGAFYAAPGMLINAGTIIAAYGIAFAGLGSANNSGTIIGTATGAKLVQTVEAAPLLPIANAPPPVLVNSGVIAASLTDTVNAVGKTVSGMGVTLTGGDIYNLPSGTIAGNIAVYATGTAVASYPGVLTLSTPLYVNNAGVILGSHFGVYAKYLPATVVNSGTISVVTGTIAPNTSPGYGINLAGGGSVFNTGTIIGYTQGIIAADSLNIVNSGYVAAISPPISIRGGYAIGNGIIGLGSGTIINTSLGRVSAEYGEGIVLIAENDNFFTGQPEALPATLVNQGTVIAHYGIVFSGIGTADNSGIILASSTGASLDAGTTQQVLLNSGTIEAGGYGVFLYGTLNNTGQIAGEFAGVGASNVLVTVFNTGTITSLYGDGLALQGGGFLSVGASGLVSAYGYGVHDNGVSASIFNAGTISARAGILVYNTAAGANTVVNDGMILVQDTAINLAETFALQGEGMILNAGTILSTGTSEVIGGATYVPVAVDIDTGGTLENETGASISGAVTAVLAGNADVQNAGLIESSLASAVSNGQTYTAATVNLAAGSVLDNAAGGTISAAGIAVADFNGAGAIDVTNEGLITSAQSGVITGPGVALTLDNAGTISVAYDAVQAQAAAAVTNSGTIAGNIELAPGYDNRLIVAPTADFTGLVNGGSSSLLELESGNGALAGLGNQFINFTTIQFDPGAAWTLAGNSSGLAAGQTFTGFVAGDALDLQDVTLASQSLTIGAGGTLALGPVSLDFAGDAGVEVTITSDGATGVDIRLETAPCFCAGTRIATTGGEVAVEDLAVGDEVMTQSGAARRIIWIGTRQYDGRFIAGNHLILPVCIRAGALGPGVPRRDLWVSPGHAIWIAGTLVPAWRLIDGVSVVQAERVESVQYFHVELAAHDVILAENCPTESFYDNGCRAQFQRSTGTAAPTAPPLARMEDGFALEALRRRLNGSTPARKMGQLRGFIDQAGPVVSGWAQDTANPEHPVSLDVLCAGRRVARLLANQYRADLRAAGIGSGCHGFQLCLPDGFTGTVEIRASGTGARLMETEAALASVA